MTTTRAFEDAYQKLNPEQKKAVDTVEGPVMVLAGPGTGKTHILTLRIANILRQTQARPDAILALTFTESAARTMRRRLAQVVGDEVARKVTITTFHGFAELVHADYPQAFAEDAAKRLMGDVEETLLLREAIDGADIAQLRPPKAPYTYLRDLGSLYGNLSREAISLAAYRAWGKEEAKRLETDESLKYKRGEHAGEFTKAGLEKVARLAKVDEAAVILERYDALKAERNLQDFDDLLSGVIRRIRDDEALRSDLQERYQYLLADEHQDANALQHQLLELFAYDDHPNLFVVGDEKQAIYRFQGADVDALRSFTEHYPRATVVELAASFRSYQEVLDAAHEVVAHTGSHARLAAHRGRAGSPAVVRITADDPLDERARVALLVERRIAEGALPHDIAIIARTNDTADLFADALAARGLPVLRAGDLSLTARPLMRALIALMEYVADPTRIGSLRTALLAPWWRVSTAELLTTLRTSRDSELVSRVEASFPEIGRTLAQCVDAALRMAPAACFSYLFAESGSRDYLLSHAEHLDDIALVRKLMMHLEEAALHTEAATFAAAMDALLRAREHGLSPVKVSVTEREGFVTVITAHKAKGMEFRFVVVPDCTEQAWERGGKSGMIPSPFENKQSLDDARRLFYVALTRAKDTIYLSYARESGEGRERMPTTLMPASLADEEVEREALPQLHASIDAPAAVRELVARYLDADGLSPSAVNEYLVSPSTFFARRVLRIKEPPVPALVYGSAVHAALAARLEELSEEDAYAALERAFARSLLIRDRTFDKLRADARHAVEASMPMLASLGTPKHIEESVSMTRLVDGAPVTLGGKLDATFDTADGLFIADFKTGRDVSAKNEGYARQLALYAALLEQNAKPVAGAFLLGISEDGIKQVPVPVGSAERATALAELDEVVRELRSGKWRKGEPSEYDAVLALLDRPAPMSPVRQAPVR